MNSRILYFDKFKIQLFLAIIFSSTLLFTCTSEPEIKKPLVKALKGETWSGGKMVFIGANFGAKNKPAIKVGKQEAKVLSFSDKEIHFEVPYGQTGKIYLTKDKKTYATKYVVETNPELPTIYAKKIDSLADGKMLSLEGDNFGVDMTEYLVYIYDTEGIEREAIIETVSNHSLSFKAVADSNVVLLPKFKLVKNEQAIVFHMPDFEVKSFNFLKTLSEEPIQQDNLHTLFDTENVALAQEDIHVFIDNAEVKNLNYVSKELVSSQTEAISETPSVVFYINDTFYPPINPRKVVQWTDASLWQTDLIDRVGMKNPGVIKSLSLKLGKSKVKTTINEEEHKITVNFPVSWSRAKHIKSNFVFAEGTVLNTDFTNFDWINPQKIVVTGEDGQEVEYEYLPKIVGSNKIIHFSFVIGEEKYKANINHAKSTITLKLPVTTLTQGEIKPQIKVASGARINGQKFPLHEWRKQNEIEVISVNGKAKNYKVNVVAEGQNLVQSMYINTSEGEVMVDSIDHATNTMFAQLPQYFISEEEEINITLDVSPEAMYETPKLTKDHFGDYTSTINITSIDGKARAYAFKGEVLDNIFERFNLVGQLYTYKGHIDNINNTIEFFVNFNEDMTKLKTDFAISEEANLDYDIEGITNWDSAFEFGVTSANGKERRYNVIIKRTVMAHDDIRLTTQKQIETFANAKFEGVVGSLTIRGNRVTSLKPLRAIKKVNGDFTIEGTLNLETMTGLNNLDTVTGNFTVENNISLTNLVGLSKLNHVGGQFYIGYNIYMTSFSGLNALTSVDQGINIRGNDKLKDISKLSSLAKLKGDNKIGFNDELEQLFNTEVSSIEGNLNMMFNEELKDLSGLASVQDITGDFILAFNPKVENLDMMTSLTNVGKKFIIHGMSGLEDVNSLKAMQTIGNHVSLRYNENMKDISGLLKFNFGGKKLRISDNAILKNVEDYKTLFATQKPEVLNIANNGWKEVPEVLTDQVEGGMMKAEDSTTTSVNKAEANLTEESAAPEASSTVDQTETANKKEVAPTQVESTTEKPAENTAIEIKKEANSNDIGSAGTDINQEQFANEQLPDQVAKPVVEKKRIPKKSILDVLTKIGLTKPFQKKIEGRKGILFFDQEDYDKIVRSYKIDHGGIDGYISIFKTSEDDVFVDTPTAMQMTMFEKDVQGYDMFEESYKGGGDTTKGETVEDTHVFNETDLADLHDGIDSLFIRVMPKNKDVQAAKQ